MNKQNWIHKTLTFLLCLLLTAAFLPGVSARAADGPCSLRIEYLDGKSPIVGAKFRVWRVADLESDGEHTLQESFKGSNVKLNGRMSNEEWEDAAKKLYAWAKQDGIPAEQSGTIGADGSLSFAGLNEGIWLVNGDSYQVGDYIYTPQTFCVVIPGLDAAGEPVYSVTVSPKFESAPVSKPARLIVAKTVTGNAGETDRAFHFTVTLSDRTLDGRYGDMLFSKGIARFSLKHGERAAALNLPEGIAYTVKEREADQDGYDTSSTGETGTLRNGGTARARFVNHKEKSPADNSPDNHPDNRPDDRPNNSPGNPPNNAPVTGDDSHPGFWLTLMLISIMGVLSAVLCKRHNVAN